MRPETGSFRPCSACRRSISPRSSARTRAERLRPSRYASPALLGAVAVLLTCIARLVYEHTIAIVEAKGLLPRWDVASHLGAGWLDYHYLITGQIHRLLWDLWMQGYWPPMHSIYQIPFYLLRGPAMSSGLSSSLVAFVLAGITGTMLLWRQWRWASLLPVSLYLGLLISSPLLLAYASVTMTEMLGALAQLLVLLCYLRYRQRPDRATARLFAISLTTLFFTKYNYFLMLAVPLVLHEWLDRTKGWGVQRKAAAFWGWTRRVLSTPAGALLGLYLAGVLAILLTGGFEFHVSGQRVSVRSIGNTGHVVLYIVILRFIYLYRRGRLDRWRTTSDDLVRAIFVWFVVPVTIWLASPYPNHIKDFFNLVINRPMGAPSVEAGAMSYVSALRTEYFYSPWVIAIALAIFVVAAIRYWRQPPLMQWLILTVVLQFGVIAVHQTRFARFLILPVVLLCLAASAEVGAWLRTDPGANRRRIPGARRPCLRRHHDG